MPKTKRSILPAGALLALFIGAVLVPALLSVSVGILALALWQEAFDIVFGVLVLAFAAMSIAGAVIGMAFVRRSARLAELQSDFIANVSHELRTPLAGVRLLVETLAMGRPLTPAQHEEILVRLGGEQRRLEELIEQILQWRRLTSAPPQLPRSRCGPRELVEEVVQTAWGAAPGAELRINVPDGLPPIWGAHRDLVMALGNLIDNALKFAGDHGPVEIVGHAKGPEIVVLEVRDQGPGIPLEEQKRIFDQFYRVPTQRRPGTGLGLAIVRRIARDHKGQVSVTSAPGEGARFALELPAADQEQL